MTTATKRRSGRPAIGRPSKGDRVVTWMRLPREVREMAEEAADRDGLALSDALVRVVCEAFGQPIPDYCRPKVTGQTELPIAHAS